MRTAKSAEARHGRTPLRLFVYVCMYVYWPRALPRGERGIEAIDLRALGLGWVALRLVWFGWGSCHVMLWLEEEGEGGGRGGEGRGRFSRNIHCCVFSTLVFFTVFFFAPAVVVCSEFSLAGMGRCGTLLHLLHLLYLLHTHLTVRQTAFSLGIAYTSALLYLARLLSTSTQHIYPARLLQPT